MKHSAFFRKMSAAAKLFIKFIFNVRTLCLIQIHLFSLSCDITPSLLHSSKSFSLLCLSVPAFLCSDGGMGHSQDDSIVGTKQCRHSVAIMPIPGNLSSSSPDLLQPATSVIDFSNPAGEKNNKLLQHFVNKLKEKQ